MRFVFTATVLLIVSSAFGQIDTVFYTQNEFSVSLRKDSCHGSNLSNNTKQYVALGNPDELCDRTYYKNGLVFDRKKSWAFGYVYALFDSSGMVRKHQINNRLLNYTIALELTNKGQVFFSHVEAKQPTNYFLLPNGSFDKIVTPLTHPTDSAMKATLTLLLQQYGPKQSSINRFPLQYTIQFLRNGMIESAGYYYLAPGNKQVRIGLWTLYDLLCDCYREKVYVVKQ